MRRFSLLLALLPVTAVLVGWVVARPAADRARALSASALVVVGVIVQERDELAPIEAEVLTEPS